MKNLIRIIILILLFFVFSDLLVGKYIYKKFIREKFVDVDHSIILKDSVFVYNFKPSYKTNYTGWGPIKFTICTDPNGFKSGCENQYRYLKNWSWIYKNQYQLILFSIIIYIAWVLLFQNVIYKSRHILPVLLFTILFIVQGYRYCRVYQPFIANMIATVLLLSLIQITFTLTAQHKTPNAISQLTRYVEELNDSLDVISIPLINYYLQSHGVKKNFIDIDIHKEQNINQVTNIRKNNIVIGDFRKLFEENYIIIPDTVFYHNPYVNRMWSKIDTYHLIK